MPNNASAAFFRASNLIAMDYPYHGAIASALRICDEVCVVVGQSVDKTREAMYALQAETGKDRIKVREETFVFDRGWQERWWDWCRQMTKADWHMYHDMDEVIHQDDAPSIRDALQQTDLDAIIFPMIHLYATGWYLNRAFAMKHNARLGRASAGYRMRNLCSDARPHDSACAMRIKRKSASVASSGDALVGEEIDAHTLSDGRAMWTHTPILHYGWCRTPQALAISQAKHYAWYADGAGLQDGQIPTVLPYEFRLQERIASGDVLPYTGDHAAGMQSWMAAHVRGWTELEHGYVWASMRQDL